MTAVMARWRPIRSANSLPRMLAGIASTENSTLTTIGVRIELLRIPHRHEGPERDDPGPDAVELEAMRAIAEHETHGLRVLEHRREIQQAALRRLRLDRPQQEADRQHHQRTEGRHQECGPPAPGFGDELGNQKRQADAEREARRVERDRARRIARRQPVGQRLEPGHVGAGKADAGDRVEQRARPQARSRTGRTAGCRAR